MNIKKKNRIKKNRKVLIKKSQKLWKSQKNYQKKNFSMMKMVREQSKSPKTKQSIPTPSTML